MTENVLFNIKKDNGDWKVIKEGLTAGLWHVCRKDLILDEYKKFAFLRNNTEYRAFILTNKSDFLPHHLCPACKTPVPDDVLVTIKLLGD